MKILFVGDIVGQPGRRAVRALVPKLRLRHGVDFVIANGENAAGGNGITPAVAEEIFESGVDVITSGDHVWDQKEVLTLLDKEPRFLRPANYPAEVPGRGWGVYEAEGRPAVAVMNLQGRTFMPAHENPFRLAQQEVLNLRSRTRVVVVDFHAEATSEKIAMGRMLDGLATAVLGTHTHVPTADEQIFPGGTAFISDVGFTGPQESVLGREIEPVIRRFLTGMPQRFEVARGRTALHGVLVEVEEGTGKATAITRVVEPLAVEGGA
ncbi:MAG: TIGR00282 family metallophosphoesterase [Verrucomicrobiae bacterium]|nr:TIGR00282 family metallophosphoesterase [Verrucomicrobiae bacterium]